LTDPGAGSNVLVQWHQRERDGTELLLVAEFNDPNPRDFVQSSGVAHSSALCCALLPSAVYS